MTCISARTEKDTAKGAYFGRLSMWTAIRADPFANGLKPHLATHWPEMTVRGARVCSLNGVLTFDSD
jgi:hypothetical protein